MDDHISFEKDNFPTIQKFPHPMQKTIMCVVAYRENEIIPLGTCFAITNDGLVMTAKHVIEEEFNTWKRDTSEHDKPWSIGAIYLSSDTPENHEADLLGGILTAQRVHFNNHHDIALMHLGLPINTQTGKLLSMPVTALSPGIPEINQHCFGIGYHSMVWNKKVNIDKTFEVNQSFSASRGIIEEIHYPCLDNTCAYLNFPCFRTSARFDPGMSGGPLLNENGKIAGVICKGAITEDGYYSHVSLIGPALLLELDVTDNHGNIIKKRLYDLIEGGSVPSDDTYNNLKIHCNDDCISIDFGNDCIYKTRVTF